MRTLLRILGVLVAVVFVFVTLAVVFSRPWFTLGLRSQLYKDVLAQEHLYERAPALVGESLRAAAEAKAGAASGAQDDADAGAEALVAIVRQLEPQDWTALIGGVVPPSLLQSEFERGLDQAEQFLHGGDGTTSATISLVEVKARLAGPAATEAYAAMLARKPPCTAEQWEASLGVPVSCRPTPDKMAEAMDNFGRVTRAMADQLPDQLHLFQNLENLAGPEGNLTQLVQLRVAVRRMELVGTWSPVVPIALALLIVLLAVRSFRDLLLWWGVPCLVIGAFGSLVAIGVISVGIGVMNGVATADLPPDAPVALVEAIVGLSSGIVRVLVMPALWASVALGGAGLVAVVLAFVLRRQGTPPPQVPA